MNAPAKIKVLVVDDSATSRKFLCQQLVRDPSIEIVGTAADAYEGRDKILELKPDVLMLDIEMPKMDGITFLKILMKHHPMPIIIFSSLSQAGSRCALEALQLGAVDVVGKPSKPTAAMIEELGWQLVEKVKAASLANLHRSSGDGLHADISQAPAKPPLFPYHPRQLILLGASTGGTEALREVLTRLPRELPGICVVQHIPAHFSRAFADRLNTVCDLEVREAEQGDVVKPGVALIAPGDFHLVLRWTGKAHLVELTKSPLLWHQRPSVDILFDSAVDCGAGPYTVAGLLTGMGRDGAEGLLHLRESHALTYAQDEATSVVFGMPRVAMELGAARQMLPLHDFPRVLSAGTHRIAQIEAEKSAKPGSLPA